MFASFPLSCTFLYLMRARACCRSRKNSLPRKTDFQRGLITANCLENGKNKTFFLFFSPPSLSSLPQSLFSLFSLSLSPFSSRKRGGLQPHAPPPPPPPCSLTAQTPAPRCWSSSSPPQTCPQSRPPSCPAAACSKTCAARARPTRRRSARRAPPASASARPCA